MNVKSVRIWNRWSLARIRYAAGSLRDLKLGTGAKLPPFTFQELLRVQDIDLIQAKSMAPHLIHSDGRSTNSSLTQFPLLPVADLGWQRTEKEQQRKGYAVSQLKHQVYLIPLHTIRRDHHPLLLRLKESIWL